MLSGILFFVQNRVGADAYISPFYIHQLLPCHSEDRARRIFAL